MSQHVIAKRGRFVEEIFIPAAAEEVLPGVLWGDHTYLFTPAYWRTLAWLKPPKRNTNAHRLGKTLKEEVVACLLGGYGIPAEIGLAAFAKIKNDYSFDRAVGEEELFKFLSEPLSLGNRTVKYRFPRVKARYISNALSFLLDFDSHGLTAKEFRQSLLQIDGIGYKTSSWITRNWLDSDEVAIIDIHIHRAGMLMDLYNPSLSPSRNYLRMEELFLELASSISVRPSELDAIIWQEMRFAGNIVTRQFRKS